jgi:homogentisate 1,2-dioxygenase
MHESLHYLSGFGNFFASEAIANSLPKDQNNPQKVPHGLYAEQLSGDAFTAAYKNNHRTWLYRIHPSVKQGEFVPYQQTNWLTPPFAELTPPTAMRWLPLPYPQEQKDFIDSLITYAGHGSVRQRSGAAIHLYAATTSMVDRYFYNADGDFLIVPQEGSLLLKTELGQLQVGPMEIALIPRGLKFQVQLLQEKARGYVCENFGAAFEIPNKGLIGPNALAEARHFLAPMAHYEDQAGELTLLTKFDGHLWAAPLKHSPLDVIAWHGNYAPYKYDLRLYTTVYSVTWDHTDPSIFTVLSAPSTQPGVSNVDFVIFPPRWLVMENTMRLPYFHRNTMSEYMGLITGSYDAKTTASKTSGFLPGGGSLHNCMTPHGPDANAYAEALQKNLQPEFYQNTLAFMFESFYTWQISAFAHKTETRDADYLKCWQDLPKTFKK